MMDKRFKKKLYMHFIHWCSLDFVFPISTYTKKSPQKSFEEVPFLTLSILFVMYFPRVEIIQVNIPEVLKLSEIFYSPFDQCYWIVYVVDYTSIQ